MKILLFLFFIVLIASNSFAHRGGTDECGCHYNNINNTLYHCHKRKKIGGDCPPYNYKPKEDDVFNKRIY